MALLSDGAPWIWERLDWVQDQVGLAPRKTQRIVDWCHVVHHVSLALQTLNLSKFEFRTYESCSTRSSKVLTTFLLPRPESPIDKTCSRILVFRNVANMSANDAPVL